MYNFPSNGGPLLYNGHFPLSPRWPLWRGYYSLRHSNFFDFIISLFIFRPNVCKHRIPIGVFRKCRKIPGKRRLQCRYINYISKPPKWWLSGSLRICDCLFSICTGPNSIIWQNIGAVPDIPKWKKVPDVQKVWPRCAIGPGPSTLHDWEGSSYWAVFTPY